MILFLFFFPLLLLVSLPFLVNCLFGFPFVGSDKRRHSHPFKRDIFWSGISLAKQEIIKEEKEKN